MNVYDECSGSTPECDMAKTLESGDVPDPPCPVCYVRMPELNSIMDGIL